MLYHSVMHACMQGLRLITAGHAAAYGPGRLAPPAVRVCVQRVHVLCVACAHGKTTAADAWVAVARHVGTSTSRHDPRSVSACVRDQGAAGRPARGGPGWALGVGGCILFLAGREAVDHALGRRGPRLRPLFDGECRLPRAQETTATSKSQYVPGYIHCSRGMPFHEEKASSHGVIRLQGAPTHTDTADAAYSMERSLAFSFRAKRMSDQWCGE